MVVLSGVATTSGLLSDNPGIEWAMSKLGGGGGNKPVLHFLYIIAKNPAYRSSYAFSNFVLAFTISWRTALIFIVLRTELVHLYTDSIKYMLKSFRFTLTRPQSDLNRLFHPMIFIRFTIQLSLEKNIIQAIFLYSK